MVFYTCCTLNHLAQATVLARSLLQYNDAEEHRMLVFLLDKIDPEFDQSALPFELIEINETNFPSLHEFVEKYTAFELICYLKSEIAIWLYTENTGDKIVYLDTDILVMNEFSLVETLLDFKPFIITPHIIEPTSIENKTPEEKTFFNSGIYNAGFFAFKATPLVFSLLQWWNDRLKQYCKVDTKRGLFVDQIWLNHMPVLFHSIVHVLLDKGHNMAYWNLGERRLHFDGHTYSIKNTQENIPLVFFHFSGYETNKPQEISKYQDKYSFDEQPVLKQLFKKYHQLLQDDSIPAYADRACFYYPVGFAKIFKAFS